MKDKEIEEELTVDNVLKKIKAVKGITAIHKMRRVMIKSGNNLLFILLYRGEEGVTIKGRDKEGKWRMNRIEKPEDLKPWYDYAKKEVKKVSK